MEERDDYKFLKLRDAIACLNQRVNLVGVVLELGLPKKSKGTGTQISLFPSRPRFAAVSRSRDREIERRFSHVLFLSWAMMTRKGRAYGCYREVGSRLMIKSRVRLSSEPLLCLEFAVFFLSFFHLPIASFSSFSVHYT